MFVLIAPRVEYTILVDFLVGQRQVNDKVKVKAFFAMMTRKLHPPQTVPTRPGRWQLALSWERVGVAGVRVNSIRASLLQSTPALKAHVGKLCAGFDHKVSN